MDDVGYTRGGSGIDSIGSGHHQRGFMETEEAEAAGVGEWHFHVFGETVGLFALDVRQGGAGLQVQVEPRRRVGLFVAGVRKLFRHLTPNREQQCPGA